MLSNRFPTLFPKLSERADAGSEQRDALQLHDLLDLFGQREGAAISAELLLPRAQVVMNSRFIHVSATSTHSAAEVDRASRRPRFFLPATRPLVRGVGRACTWFEI